MPALSWPFKLPPSFQLYAVTLVTRVKNASSKSRLYGKQKTEARQLKFLVPKRAFYSFDLAWV
jgi:hypothetical protein